MTDLLTPSRDTRALARKLLSHRPASAGQLHRWVRVLCDLHVPRRRMCPGHVAPFDYVRASFFGQPDLLIWANRGGGKTTLAALACLLDALFRGPLTAAVLAGSFDQADRLVEHLRRLLTAHEALLEPRWVRDRLELGEATVLTLSASQRSVRGLRAQKLRCDEVDLFTPELWRAAQFVTQSTDGARGSMEVFSTLHRAGGLMDQLVERAQRGDGDNGYQLMQWCLWEVIERCGRDRHCGRCPLDADCRGRAKQAEGFFAIDDAIAIRGRVSRAAWESEMLCLRPRAEDLVFEEFRRSEHVASVDYQPDWPVFRAIDFGYAAPLVCLWIQLSPAGAVVVLDEYVQKRRNIETHAAQIFARERSRGWARPKATYVDPAGQSREVATGRACTELLAAAGIYCSAVPSAIADGVELIRTQLAPADPTSPAVLRIHPRCRSLIAAFEQYHYAGATGRPAKDGPDHCIDALRYFFVNRRRPRQSARRGRY